MNRNLTEMKSKYANFWHKAAEVLTKMPRRLRNDGYFRIASALSFTTILATVPLITVVFSMLSLFPVFEVWSGVIEDFIFDNFVPQLGAQIKTYLVEFSQNAGQLTIVGLAFLIVSTLLLLSTIEDAFNGIWKVEAGRPWVQRLLVYWAMLTLGPILIALSLTVSSYLFSLEMLNQTTVFGFKRFLLERLPFIFELLAFVLMYNAIPNCDVKLRHALAGGLVAALLFELAKSGFAAYLTYFNTYQLIYGAIAALPIFLIWMYLSWLVVLIGAYIAAALHLREIKES